MPNSQFAHRFNWMSSEANVMRALSHLMLPKFFLKVMDINCTKYWVSLWLFHKCVRYNLIIFTHQFPSSVPSCPLVGLFPLYSTWVFLKLSFTMSEKSVLSSSLAYFTEHQAHPLSYKQYGYICCFSFNPSSADWHLGWLCYLASMNNAFMDMDVQALLLSVTLIRHLPKSVHQNAAESHGSSTFSPLRHLLFSLFPVN